MRRLWGAASGVFSRFSGFEDRIRKLGAVGAWLCCMLLIGLGVSPAAIAQTTVTYIHTDALGSVVAESDANGNVIKRYDYEPYGAVVGGQLSDGPGYTGHVSDSATGLSYMQQRYMDPQLGVFLSVDPVTTYSKGDVRFFNRYTYAFSNPYRFSDPDGRESVGEMIDSGAEGCGAVSCAGWAALSATWTVFGAEGISQISDKGWSDVGKGDRAGAGLEVASVIPFVKVGAGVGSVFRTFRAALNSGQKAYKGSTVMGHALSKHAGRNPEIWGKMAGAMRTWNDQAMKHFRDIVRGPGEFKEVANQDGTKFLEKSLEDGRGVRLNMNGTFKGFIDK